MRHGTPEKRVWEYVRHANNGEPILLDDLKANSRSGVLSFEIYLILLKKWAAVKKDAKGLNQALSNGWIKLLKEEGTGEGTIIKAPVRVVSCVLCFPSSFFLQFNPFYIE